MPALLASGECGKAGGMMADKEYELLRSGVSQMQDGKWVERKKGELVTLTREAAEHLAAEGFIEDPKAKRTKTEATK